MPINRTVGHCDCDSMNTMLVKFTARHRRSFKLWLLSLPALPPTVHILFNALCPMSGDGQKDEI